MGRFNVKVLMFAMRKNGRRIWLMHFALLFLAEKYIHIYIYIVYIIRAEGRWINWMALHIHIHCSCCLDKAASSFRLPQNDLLRVLSHRYTISRQMGKWLGTFWLEKCSVGWGWMSELDCWQKKKETIAFYCSSLCITNVFFFYGPIQW